MTIARKLSYSTLMNLVSYGAGLLASILVARLLGPEVLGDFSSQLAMASLWGYWANRGLGGAHMQLYPRAEEQKDYISSYLVLKLAFVLLMLIAASAYCFYSTDITNKVVFMICVGAIALEELYRIPMSHFNALLEKFKAELPTFVGSFWKCVFKSLVAFMGLGVIGLSASEALGGVCVLLVSLYFFRKVHLGRVRLDIVKAYLYLSIPLLFVQLMANIAPNLDKVMINSLWFDSASNTEVAMYTAGQRLSSIITIFTMVVSSVFFPAFAGFAKDKDYSKAENIIKSYESVVMCIIAPAFLAMAVFSKPIILFLVGGEYANASPVMQVSVVGALSVLLLRPYMSFIIGALDSIWTACTLNVVFILFVFALNIAMIPNEFLGYPMFGLGSFGAAVGTTISYLLIGVLSKSIANRSIATDFLSRNGVEGAMLAGMTLIFLWGVSLANLESIWLAALGSVGFMMLYFTVLLLFRRKKVKELVVIMQKVHPIFVRIETILFGRNV